MIARKDSTKGSPAKRLALIMGTQDCRAALKTILLPAVVRAQHVALLAPARGRWLLAAPLGDACGAGLEGVLNDAGTQRARRRHQASSDPPGGRQDVLVRRVRQRVRNCLERHCRYAHHCAVRWGQLPRVGCAVREGQRPVACKRVHACWVHACPGGVLVLPWTVRHKPSAPCALPDQSVVWRGKHGNGDFKVRVHPKFLFFSNCTSMGSDDDFLFWDCFLGQVCLSGGFLPLRTLVRLGSTSARLRAVVSKALQFLPDIVVEDKGCSRRLDCDTVVSILAAVGGTRTHHVSLKGCYKLGPRDMVKVADLLARRFPALASLDVSTCQPLARLCLVWLTIKEEVCAASKSGRQFPGPARIEQDGAVAAGYVEWSKALVLAQSHNPHRKIGRLMLGDVDHQFPCGPTVADLHVAARAGVLPLLELLLLLTLPVTEDGELLGWRRLGVDEKLKNGDRALHAACRKHGNTPVLRRLLEARADVNGLGYGMETALHCVCEKNGDTEMLSLLLAHGAAVDAKDRENVTSLHRALRLRDACVRRRAVLSLLSRGASVTVANGRREMPLHVACEIGDLELVEEMLRRGADLEGASLFAPRGLTMRHGSRPLHVASRLGHMDVVNALLDKGALVNSVDQLGWSSLGQARTKACRDALVAAGATFARLC
jgi:hypothetical protein